MKVISCVPDERVDGRSNLVFSLCDAIDEIERGIKGSIKVIREEKKDVLYIPRGAIRTVNDQKAVYIIDEDGLRSLRYIEIGLLVSSGAVSDDNRAEIITGLTEGDQVIMR